MKSSKRNTLVKKGIGMTIQERIKQCMLLEDMKKHPSSVKKAGLVDVSVMKTENRKDASSKCSVFCK